jgi:hypothetical protein
MAEDFDIDDLVADAVGAAGVRLGALLDEVVRRAYAAGQAAERQRVVEMINSREWIAAPDAVAAHVEPRPAFIPEPKPPNDPLPPADSQRRAPRGLTREVLDLVLTESPQGLPLDELQRQVVEIDSRVSPKTVYNELMRGRGKKYRSSLGRWHLIGITSDVKPTSHELAQEALHRILG